MMPFSVARVAMFSFAIACASCAFVVAIMAVLEWRSITVQAEIRRATTPESSYNPKTYQESLVVESVDPASMTMIAIVGSKTAGQNIRTRLHWGKDFSIERRDPVIENGTIVSMTDTVPASILDLLPGVRGIGRFQVNDDGTIQVSDLLIGNPFPRP